MDGESIYLQFALISFFFATTVQSVLNCCDQKVLMANRTICDNNKPISLQCDGLTQMLNNKLFYFTSYIIRNDTRGEYLDDYVGGFIVRDPNFCTGRYKFRSGVSNLAVICSTAKIRYHDLKTVIDESNNMTYVEVSYWSMFNNILRIVSSLLLAITFYIYVFVLPTRQMEDDCLLHFVGALFSAYLTYLYNTFSSSEGMLPNLCITNLYATYFLILSSFAWLDLFMYHPWKEMKINLSLDQSGLIQHYRFIGFGIPALLIVAANIHAHAGKLYSEFQFEINCYIHQYLIENLYFFIPTFLAVGFNLYFWRDIINQGKNITKEDFNENKINDLLTLNRKLLIVFALPWLSLPIVNELSYVVDYDHLYIVWVVISMLTSGNGIGVSLFLVMSRPRVWKCVFQKYETFRWLQKWQPKNDEEIITSIEEGNHHST